MMMLVLVFSSALATSLLLWFLLHTSLGKRFIDRPNERSLHVVPTPRIGGLAIAIVTLLLCIVFAKMLGLAISQEAGLLWGSFAALAVLGMIDDRFSLSAAVRAAIHLLIVTTFVFVAVSHKEFAAEISILSTLFAVLAIGWSANLCNFMDGSDGLVGLSAAIGLSTLAWLAPSGSLVSLTAAILAGACAGFLLFNWQPARVFLGDAGSVPIGFAAAALGLLGVLHDYWQWWIPVGCFLPLVFDSTVTLTHRVLRGEKPWRAHREHAYQRLILSGRPHAVLAKTYGFLSLICCFVAATTRYQYGYVSFALWTVIILILIGGFIKALKSTPQAAG